MQQITRFILFPALIGGFFGLAIIAFNSGGEQNKSGDLLHLPCAQLHLLGIGDIT